VNNSR